MSEINAHPPRDNLMRFFSPGLELREDEEQGNTLVSRFAVFDEWVEIDSWFEGRFLERIQRGAFRKTMKENRAQIQPLFQHGQDPQVGSKPLGTIEDLREEDDAAVGEVALFDTAYNRELLPALQAGVLGSSFRFQVVREAIDETPVTSEVNPQGLPERTIKEVRLFEFGPVSFPAYPTTSAGMRSLTFRDLTGADQTTPSGIIVPRDLAPSDEPVQSTEDEEAPPVTDDAPVEGDAGSESHPAEDAPRSSEDEAAATEVSEARDQEKEQDMENYRTKPEIVARQSEVQDRLEQIAVEFGAATLPDDVKGEFDVLGDEKLALIEQLAAAELREKIIGVAAGDPKKVETPVIGRGGLDGWNQKKSNLPDDIYALDEYRMNARTPDEHRQLLRDGALKATERMTFAHDRADEGETQAHIERLLDNDNRMGEIAQRIIATSSPLYERAFGKTLAGRPLSPDETRAMGASDSTGGFAVPAALDPTVVPTSDGAINPIRQIARVETITGDSWKGVTSAGVTATRTTEAAQATDDAPTFAGPEIVPTRVQVWIPFSYEIGQDFAGLQAELSRMLSDAKDMEEAEQFITGNGDPEGVVAGLALSSHVTSDTVNGFEVADLYKLKNALPPRFRSRARFLANDNFYSEIRQLDTSGGASLWTQLGSGTPDVLLGKPAHEASDMAATSVSGDEVLLYGDFSYYCIVDRIGMSIELVPHVFGAQQRPTGQRGVFAFWRNSAEILSDSAFRVLTIGATS